MTISRVTIKGFHNVENKTYELRNLNYLFGRNGAGKSTVLQAIQLALLGYIPGTNKTNVAIFTHANGPLISIKVDFADSEIKSITRNFVKSGKSVVTSVDVVPNKFTAKDVEQMLAEVELPIFNFGDFVGMTANTMKDWFINFLPKAKMDIDWKTVFENAIVNTVPDETRAKLSAEYVQTCDQFYGNDGIEAIRGVNSYLKSAQSAKKAEYQRVVDTIQSLVYYDDIDTTANANDIDDQIKKLQTAKNEYLANMREYDYAQAALKNYEKELATLSDLAEHLADDQNYITVKRKIDELYNERDCASEIIDECEINRDVILDNIKEIQAEIKVKQSIIDGNGICPYTKNSCPEICNIIDGYKHDIEELNKQLDVKHAELSKVGQKILEAEETYNRTFDMGTTIACDKLKIERKYDRRDELKALITDSVIPAVDADNIDYDTEIYELYNLKTKIAANEKYNSLIDKLTADKFELEYELEALKTWINLTGVNGMQVSNETGSVFAPLAAEMNPVLKTLMGEGTEVYFNEIGKANSFSFGIMRHEGYIEYDLLSSGEKCLFALALLIGIVNISSTPLKLLMIDDAFDHLDSDNVENTFNTLSNIKDVQMVFAGVKEVHTDNAKDFVINIG